MISTKIADSFLEFWKSVITSWRDITYLFYVGVSQQFYRQDVALMFTTTLYDLTKLTPYQQIELENFYELKTPKFIWS